MKCFQDTKDERGNEFRHLMNLGLSISLSNKSGNAKIRFVFCKFYTINMQDKKREEKTA